MRFALLSEMLIGLVVTSTGAVSCNGRVAGDVGGTSPVGGASTLTTTQNSGSFGGATVIGGHSSILPGGTATSGGTAGSTTDQCVTAPELSSIAQGTSCPTRLSALGASATSVTLWVADPTVSGTGSRLTLIVNQDVVANNHTYRFNGSASLFGTGSVDGVALVAFGYLEIAVDSAPAQVQFDIAGCASLLGSASVPAEYSYSARVSRQRSDCTSCTADTVLRNFTVRASDTQGSGSYTFDNTGDPQGCSFGIDLLGFTLG